MSSILNPMPGRRSPLQFRSPIRLPPSIQSNLSPPGHPLNPKRKTPEDSEVSFYSLSRATARTVLLSTVFGISAAATGRFRFVTTRSKGRKQAFQPIRSAMRAMLLVGIALAGNEQFELSTAFFTVVFINRHIRISLR